ncbi:LOW QUALITY PROTEIN: insulin-like receptor [Drosophila sulfurigaster albostrigata]|uniref:LOW QUALITY PROTEIN: insulin-like receptor n=1 Tax=Drosophila sulfurigaster albostrigata TaxID=89887 RepID=UPI002D21D000|nr:LOW QUALITY PROTEIN: insulin-like receptor [Drosophila sulfurigaster albostrigata]
MPYLFYDVGDEDAMMVTSATTTTTTKMLTSLSESATSTTTKQAGSASASSHDNICVLCRRVFPATCCSSQRATCSNNSNSSSSYADINCSLCRSRDDATFPNKLASAQHCGCQHQHQQQQRWQQHRHKCQPLVANDTQHAPYSYRAAALLTAATQDERNFGNSSSSSSSNSTNDNNQKETANCHCNCNSNSYRNNPRQNINTNNSSKWNINIFLLTEQLQKWLLYCGQLLARHRRYQTGCHQRPTGRLQKQQHYNVASQRWRQQSIALTLITLLTLQTATTMAQQQQPQQQQYSRSSFAHRLERHSRSPNTIDDNINRSSRDNSIANSNSNSNSTFIDKYRNNMRLARPETYCKSMDLRNTPALLNSLENCTIVEGFLLITLMNMANYTTSFPLLTEITGYLVFYRMSHLYSLSQLFPNLSVIRGNVRFESYALVVYSNPDLEDLSLTNLRAITNGGVRIEKNPKLCFVSTVNWDKILPLNATKDAVVLKNNNNELECLRCPGENSIIAQSDAPECRYGSDNKSYCWNSHACQIICPPECPHNCIDRNTCCNENCIGSCTAPGVTGACTACRHVSLHNEICSDKCEEGTYMYEQRCITAEMCDKIGKKFVDNKELDVIRDKGKCTTICDADSYPDPKTHSCVKCNGPCEKRCDGINIDSALRAKELQGCTIIDKHGLSVTIKRGGPHILEELEAGLGRIHTINTYLKIHLTYELPSLSFFKSLREIKGQKTIDDRYALYVLENRDLEGIWGENQNVSINGSIFFHFNPKLCLDKIDALKPFLPGKPQTFNKNEVAEDSNGDKGICNTLPLSVSLAMMSSIFIRFEMNSSDVAYEDDRSFIGYQFYHTLDPYGNETIDSYVPCSNKWTVSEPTRDTLIQISGLTPYTNYAFYVRTKTISSEKRNYQSEIIRYKTSPAQPTKVSELSAISLNASQILVKWKPPLQPNGKLIRYIVSVRHTRVEGLIEHLRNYCKEPVPNAVTNDTYESAKIEIKMNVNEKNCTCDKSQIPEYNVENEEKKVRDSIAFENSVQNFVYVRKKTNEVPSTNATRRRRYIESDEMDDIEIDEMDDIDFDVDKMHLESVMSRHVRSINQQQQKQQQKQNGIPNQNGNNTSNSSSDAITWDPFHTYITSHWTQVDPNTTEFLFNNLQHFSYYIVSVMACREPDHENPIIDSLYDPCSEEVTLDKRVLKLDNVDKAYNLTAELVGTNANTTRGSVKLSWKPPEDPNGAIVSYTIFYERQEQNAVEEKRCISGREYVNQSGYVVNNLSEGKYGFQIRANSLAGEGIRTDTFYVVVPPPGISVLSLVLYCVGATLMLVLLSASIYMYYIYSRRKLPQDLYINTEVNPFYASLQYVPDDWEVPRERVLQLGSLGQGSFGMVYEGILKGQNPGDADTPCAIKTVNENATDRERTNFLSEASVMKEFDTYHVVHLLGVCSRGQPALVVMELMKKGDLKSYLRLHRPDEREDVRAAYQQRIGLTNSSGATLSVEPPPPYSRIYQMAIEIADGMAYLAAKKFVHRDLAARNCMVANDLTVKIGDFGMTRDIYETDYYRKGTKGLLPVRWMPPESLRDGVYASSSDVFSYGVVLWEMATLASQPYQGLSNEQVLRFVIDGGIMERPDNCPEVLHRLMHKCWRHRPTARPSFLDIIAYLEDLSEPRFKDVAFYYSESGVQYREKERKERSTQLDVFADAGQLDAIHVDGDEGPTPMRAGDYPGYKTNRSEHNTSLDQPAESPIAMVDDQATTHSPFSMHSAFILSSTPDALSTMPTAGGSHMEDAAYVQADVDPDAEANVALTADAERGYELYDPSPNFVELPHSGSGRLSGEQHLLPKAKRGGGVGSIVPNMSSSMPDEMIGNAGNAAGPGGGLISTSLQPSTASAASSNASSSRNPSLKRAAADMFRNRVGYGILSRFNHKRSGSNVSHKSNISNAPSNSSNTNLTSHPSGMAMVSMGPNLGTIESGGSGSAGSYTGTPRFYTPTATTPSGGGGGNGSTTIISDNPNYKLLDESLNSGMMDNAHAWPPQLTTSSLNPNYESTTAAMISDNPSYVMMNEPQAAIFTSDNPNYAPLLANRQVQPSSSDDDEHDDDDEDDDDEEEDEHTEHIKMERMPLSRPKQQRARFIKQQQQQQPRSRSVSQTRRGETQSLTPTLTPTQTSLTTPTARASAATTGNSSNILKENWLRQTTTPRPPPPNGFIGREA